MPSEFQLFLSEKTLHRLLIQTAYSTHLVAEIEIIISIPTIFYICEDVIFVPLFLNCGDIGAQL